MVLILNGLLNLEAQPFEIQTNERNFNKNHLRSEQKHPGFQIVGTI